MTTIADIQISDIRADLNMDATENQGEVIQAARENCRDHLRAGRDFAFNATNTMRQTRKRWIDLFVDYNARIELVYVEPPLSSIFEQNERRTRPVPRQVIELLVAARQIREYGQEPRLIVYRLVVLLTVSNSECVIAGRVVVALDLELRVIVGLRQESDGLIAQWFKKYDLVKDGTGYD